MMTENDTLADTVAMLVEAVKPLARLKAPTVLHGNAGAYSLFFDDIRNAQAALTASQGIEARVREATEWQLIETIPSGCDLLLKADKPYGINYVTRMRYSSMDAAKEGFTHWRYIEIPTTAEESKE